MRDYKNQSGFTLVEMALVILITGLVAGAFFAFYTPQLETKKYQTTVERQKKIARALANYALHTGGLPCPALPNPPTGTPLGTPNTVCTTPADPDDLDGIVPFRELGLTQDDSVDGYNRPFTYHVTPAAVNRDPVNLDSNCRIQDSWVDVSGVPRNKNRNKAIFCCPQVNPGDGISLILFDSPSQTTYVTPVQYGNPPADTPGPLADVDTPSPIVPIKNIPYMAYTLVSHGKNGKGSYLFGMNGPDPQQMPANNTAEIINMARGGEPEFLDFRIQTGDAAGLNYFDDIVLWRTQYGMMADIGETCAAP